MAERRFNEDEVRQIFEHATSREETTRGAVQAGSSHGMTLAQLQDVGREVGIEPQLIADAAARLERAGIDAPAKSRGVLGLPLRVERTVQLPRKLSDEEWEHLVVQLRETFDAKGSIKSEGSLRQWTNGNLQALLEVTPAGQRIRLRTFKGSAVSSMGAGLAIFAVAASQIVLAVQSDGNGAGAMTMLSLMAAAGATLATAAAVRLPFWARRRREQMDQIAERALDLTSG